MDFVNFWIIVDRHRWIPRMLIGVYERISDEFTPSSAGSLDIHANPNTIGDLFCPSAIEENIGYIAFRDWSKLDLDATYYALSRNSRSGAFLIDNEVGTFCMCFFHKPELGQAPFENRITNSVRMNPRDSKENGYSVRHLIESVHADGATLDAVVIVQVKAKSTRRDPQTMKHADPVARVVSFMLEASDEENYSYEIFRPPSNKPF